MSKRYKLIVDGNGKYYYARIFRNGGMQEIGHVYKNSDGLWEAWHTKPSWFFRFPNFTSRVFLTEAQAREWMKRELGLEDPDMPELIQPVAAVTEAIPK